MLPDSFYRDFFQLVPLAAVVLHEGRIIAANPGVLNLLEANAEDVLGQPVSQFLYALDQSRSQARIHKPEGGWVNPPAKFRVKTTKGAIRVVLVSSRSLDAWGENLVLITGQDMSEQDQMEAQLRQSELNFRRLFENMQDVYYRTDAKGVVQMVGPGVRAVLGYEPEEIEGRTAEAFYPHPEDRNALKEAILRDGKVTDFPGQMVCKDGRVIDISISSQVLRDEFGNFAGVEGIYRDVTQRKTLERELKRLATTDSLTGIDNRRAFLDHAEHVFKSAQRYQTTLTLLVLDLDFFKCINDQYGHLSGDLVLVRFTEAVKLELRESDLFGRIGGEEFCVLLQHASRDEAMQVAERIRQRVQYLSITLSDTCQVAMTVSIGMADSQPEDLRLSQVLERADRALYQAKHRGRNCVVWQALVSQRS